MPVKGTFKTETRFFDDNLFEFSQGAQVAVRPHLERSSSWSDLRPASSGGKLIRSNPLRSNSILLFFPASLIRRSTS